MPRYKFFALDSGGRVDRGFELMFTDDTAAIAHAKLVKAAARVEVVREGNIIARVLFSNGVAKLI